MPPKAQKEIIYPITSEEHFAQIVNPENKKLHVIDIHLSWCGPCTVMSSNYRTLYFGFEEADKRLEFWTVIYFILTITLQLDSTMLPDEYKKLVQASCKPKFMIFLVIIVYDKILMQEGECKGIVDGADYTKIENLVNTFIPGLDE